MIDLISNILLFIARFGTFIFSTVLVANLLADLRATAQEKRNGLWSTRVAMVSIIGALVIENLVYAIAYLHAGFNTKELNEWLTLAKPLVIFTRFGILFGTIQLYRLFCCNNKK